MAPVCASAKFRRALFVLINFVSCAVCMDVCACVHGCIYLCVFAPVCRRKVMNAVCCLLMVYNSFIKKNRGFN